MESVVVCGSSAGAVTASGMGGSLILPSDPPSFVLAATTWRLMRSELERVSSPRMNPGSRRGGGASASCSERRDSSRGRSEDAPPRPMDAFSFLRDPEDRSVDDGSSSVSCSRSGSENSSRVAAEEAADPMDAALLGAFAGDAAMLLVAVGLLREPRTDVLVLIVLAFPADRRSCLDLELERYLECKISRNPCPTFSLADATVATYHILEVGYSCLTNLPGGVVP